MDAQARLRADLASPTYQGLSDAAAAEMIEVLLVARPRQFEWREARSLAQRMGRWPWVVARSRMVPQLPIQGLADAAILAAIGAVEMHGDQRMSPADTEAWAELEQGLEVLLAIGDLTAEVATAIRALGSELVPARGEWGFQSPLSYTDIEAARA